MSNRVEAHCPHLMPMGPQLESARTRRSCSFARLTHHCPASGTCRRAYQKSIGPRKRLSSPQRHSSWKRRTRRGRALIASAEAALRTSVSTFRQAAGRRWFDRCSVTQPTTLAAAAAGSAERRMTATDARLLACRTAAKRSGASRRRSIGYRACAVHKLALRGCSQKHFT
eukprot:1981592-Prymnesium_polylepis.1